MGFGVVKEKEDVIHSVLQPKIKKKKKDDLLIMVLSEPFLRYKKYGYGGYFKMINLLMKRENITEKDLEGLK